MSDLDGDDDVSTKSSSATKRHQPSQVLDNVIENVLQFLTDRRDRNAASLVSRHWCAAEAQTRRHLFVPNCYAVAPNRAAARFPAVRSLLLKGKPRFADFNLVPEGWGARPGPWLGVFAGLECLHLKRMSVSDEELVLLARTLLEFRELTLVCCDGFGSAGVGAVAEYCRNLRVLDLIDNDVLGEDEQTAVDWISKFPQSLTCLESLVFENLMWPVNFEALEALVGRSPGLRRLRVNHQVTVGQFYRLLMRAPQLSYVGTGAFRAQPGAMDADELDVADLEVAFSNAKSLVCLSGFHELVPQYLPAIYPVCGQLTSLNISYAQVTAEQIIPVILQCVNLQTLWVLDTVGDEGLQAVATACKDLRELRVFPLDPTEDYDASVSGVGLVAISEGCRKLESILYFCQRMTNEAVITMARNCLELVVFRLCILSRQLPDQDTGQPMDEGFGAIVMNCKNLTRLAVSGLLTDKAFEYIGRYGKLVRTLSVAFAGTSDNSLRYLLEGCPNLQKLEIRDCPFGDEGLLSGIPHFYNMRFLWMSSCRLTLRGCREVAQRLPRLVVEIIGDSSEDDDDEPVEKLYLYRSLAGPRTDAPDFVKIL